MRINQDHTTLKFTKKVQFEKVTLVALNWLKIGIFYIDKMSKKKPVH